MTEGIKEKVLSEMEHYFGEDKKRIEHAHRVTEFAQRILTVEMGHPIIVLSAAVLLNIGIREAEKKYGSTSGSFQKKEGPPLARGILGKLGFEKKNLEEVCTIIAAHHGAEKLDTMNFKIVNDASWLANLKDEYKIADRADLARIIDREFLTVTGKDIARREYLRK